MLLGLLLGILASVLLLGYFLLLKTKNYWIDRGIPNVPAPILVGNFWRQLFMIEQIKYALDRLYKHPKAKGQPFIGIHVFNKPTIFILDPELVKRVMVKDFHHFSDRHVGADPIQDPIGGNDLFQVKNPLWRKLRLKMSPIFTSGKLKQMFYLVESVGNALHKQVKRLVAQNPVVEVRDLASCFTVDTIALCAFATEAKCLDLDKNTDFKDAILSCVTSSWFRRWSVVCTFMIPSILKYLKITTFTEEFEEFIRHLFQNAVTEREKSNIIRHDLVDALIAFRRAEENDDEKSKCMKMKRK